jgi:hypothetical protein
MKVLVFKNFLSVSECGQLNEWTNLGVQNKWLDEGLSRGKWDYKERLTTRPYANRFDYSPEVYVVQNKITNFLNLANLQKSVVGGGKNGIVVSYTLNGGDTYEHIDPKEGDLEVLRCNVLTNKPAEGGELFVDGEKIDLAAGDLHCYLSSTVRHYVTETKGNVPRILWMFGYQCSQERFSQLPTP